MIPLKFSCQKTLSILLVVYVIEKSLTMMLCSFRGPRSMNVELGLILPKINVKGQVQSGSDYIHISRLYTYIFIIYILIINLSNFILLEI